MLDLQTATQPAFTIVLSKKHLTCVAQVTKTDPRDAVPVTTAVIGARLRNVNAI